MKTKTFLALFCLLCISSGFSSCQRHSSDQWKLVWEDNFDQKQALIHRSGVKYHVANQTGITI